MQKINSNIEGDNFRKILKEKLEGYSLPVNDDGWNRIENSLSKKPRKILLWPWISGTAAAAAVALFILLLYPLSDKNKQTDNYETTSLLSENAKTIDKNLQVETINRPVETPHVKPEKVFVSRKTKGEYADAGSRSEIDVTPQSPEAGNNPQPPKGESATKSTEGDFFSPPSRGRGVPMNNDPFGDDSSPVIKSKKRKSVGLSLGSSGSLTAMNTHSGDLGFNNISAQPRSNLLATYTDSKNVVQNLYEDFPKVTHRIPLSLGLTVKKELNRTFSLETGLVYTFLDSRFENRDLGRKAVRQLHYLGIPLNIQAKILGEKKSDWTVYLSAGGMVEKGIFSHCKQMSTANNNPVVEGVSNDPIAGLQYSLSLAPGIDYKIYRNYSIYFEPKISYYFDNKQPVSARTERPIVIGINAGLRFSW